MELLKKFDDVSLFFKAHPLRHYTIRLYLAYRSTWNIINYIDTSFLEKS